MILLRIPTEETMGVKKAHEFQSALKKARDDVGLTNTFAVLVDAGNGKSTMQFDLKDIDLTDEFKFQNVQDKDGNEVRKALKYEDLEGIPCILILVEKGKMGDSFPRSMKYYDLRGRYGTQKGFRRSTVEQDLGRACRYQLAADSVKEQQENIDRPLPVVLVSKNAMATFKSKPVDLRGRSAFSGTLNHKTVIPDGKMKMVKKKTTRIQKINT